MGFLKDLGKSALSMIWEPTKLAGKMTGKATSWSLDAMGKATKVGAEKTGQAIIGSASYAAEKAPAAIVGAWRGIEHKNKFVESALSPVRRYAGAVTSFDKLITKRPITSALDKKTGEMIEKGGEYRLSGAGKAVVWGGSIAGGVMAAGDTYMNNRVGPADGMMHTATPNMVPSYAKNGGASGDLVFAMNANRRG